MKKNDAFTERLYRVNKLIQTVDTLALNLEMIYSGGTKADAYEYAFKLENMAEKLVLQTRELPVYLGNKDAERDIEKMILETTGVEIRMTEQNWFYIKLPALLPKKEMGNKDYIRAILYPALKNYFSDKEPLKIKKCIIVFRHVYDKARPERQWRDHDNIETNMVTDSLAMYMMQDDGATMCSHFYCSASGEEDYTEVFVLPKKDFTKWLTSNKFGH